LRCDTAAVFVDLDLDLGPAAFVRPGRSSRVEDRSTWRPSRATTLGRQATEWRSTMALPRTKHAPCLTIVMIDDEHIDAIVEGDFGEGCPEKMLDRLGRLARCPTRTQCLRVDLSGIHHLDERAARVFADAAESAGRTGGRIEFVGASAEVERALGRAMSGRADGAGQGGLGERR
jgi:hypothetical protein